MFQLRFIIVVFLCSSSYNITAQLQKKNTLSYSFSWNPEYRIIYSTHGTNGRTYLINFESLVHYKPYIRFSFASGLGYRRASDGYNISTNSDPIEVNGNMNRFKVPIQAYFHFPNDKQRYGSYIKTEFINILSLVNSSYYQNGVITDRDSKIYYDQYLGIGIGRIFRENNNTGIKLEGSLSKRIFDKNEYSVLYIFNIKLGILIK